MRMRITRVEAVARRLFMFSFTVPPLPCREVEQGRATSRPLPQLLPGAGYGNTNRYPTMGPLMASPTFFSESSLTPASSFSSDLACVA